MLLPGILEDAGLLEPDEDLQDQFEVEVSFMERYALPDAPSSSPNSREIDQHTDSPVQARREFDDRRQDVTDARARYDAHGRSAKARKGRSISGDLADLQEGMRLAKEVIEAEERFRAVKDSAIAKGIDIATSDQTSGFGSADGQAPNPLVGPENYPEVQQWLETLPEMIGPNSSANGFLDAIDAQCPWKVEVPELDLWRDRPAVVMKDSISVVAQGQAKVRIKAAEASRELDLSAVKKHWAGENPRGLTAEQWDRGHRVFEVGQ